jgi:hypothetical protein
VLYTLWLINPKYRIFRQTRVRFTQKGKIGRLHLFFALKNRFLKKRGNRRKNEKNAGKPAFFGVHLFCTHYVVEAARDSRLSRAVNIESA